MRLIYYYILLTFVFGYSEKPFFPIFKITNATIQDLESGNIVVIETEKDYGDAKHYQVYGIIDASLNEVFDAIENFDDYPSRRIWGLTRPDSNIDHRRVR